jgi:hypothetical protein
MLKMLGPVAALVVYSAGVPAAFANAAMSTARQNELVGKYCAVCHTDAARNGGLSLEHFDAANAAPSLTAMLLSKLTSGVSLEVVRKVPSDPDAAALVANKMKSGAMGAAGIPIPDKATIDGLIAAFASESAGATEWSMNRIQDPVTKAPVLTASIARELPTARNGAAALYRLVLACNADTRQGEMQLAWSPAPKTGTLSAVVDGIPLKYDVEGRETMGNGSQAITGPAAISLYPKMPLPARTLTISNLFPNETVEFPFGDLGQTARQSLEACFSR